MMSSNGESIHGGSPKCTRNTVTSSNPCRGYVHHASELTNGPGPIVRISPYELHINDPEYAKCPLPSYFPGSLTTFQLLRRALRRRWPASHLQVSMVDETLWAPDLLLRDRRPRPTPHPPGRHCTLLLSGVSLATRALRAGKYQ